MYKQTNKRIDQQLEKEMTNQGVRDLRCIIEREETKKERKKEREKEKKK